MKINTNEISYKRLDTDIIPKLLEIQEEAFEYANGNTEFLRRNTAETLAICFPAPSAVLGAYYGGELIAFGILHAAGETKENLAHDLLDRVSDIRENANIKLTIVRPTYRGNGLQKSLIDRLSDIAKEEGFKYLSSTVSPVNIWSLTNLERCGFTKAKILQKYGGLTRILYFKEI